MSKFGTKNTTNILPTMKIIIFFIENVYKTSMKISNGKIIQSKTYIDRNN